MAGASVQIKAREVVEDLRARLEDEDLQSKYGISAPQLQKLLQKLVDGGFIDQSELNARAEHLARKKAEAQKEAFISVEPDTFEEEAAKQGEERNQSVKQEPEKPVTQHIAESVAKSMNDAANTMLLWGLGTIAVIIVIALVLSGEVSLMTIVIIIAILGGVCTGLSNYLKQKAQTMKGNE